MKRCERCSTQVRYDQKLCDQCEQEIGEVMEKVPKTDMRHELGLLTIDEIADLLDVSTATLQLWRKKGTGPNYVKAGRNVFYLKEDLYAFIRGNRLSAIATEALKAPPVQYKQEAVSYYRFPDPKRDEAFDPPLSSINKPSHSAALEDKRDKNNESDESDESNDDGA